MFEVRSDNFCLLHSHNHLLLFLHKLEDLFHSSSSKLPLQDCRDELVLGFLKIAVGVKVSVVVLSLFTKEEKEILRMLKNLKITKIINL